MNKEKSTKYKLATKHGFLKGTYSGDQLDYRKCYTGDILQIKPLELDKEKELSVQLAVTTSGGHACCNCQGTVQKYQGALVKLLVHFVVPYVTMVEVETNSVPYSVTML
jgi:hypothetical protein